MNTQALLIELLLAGFFAIACLRARANKSSQPTRLQDLFHLTGRIDRLRESRWQWISMVFLLLVIRRQVGTPVLVEFTVLMQMVVFMCLPSAKPKKEALACK
jgi:hypothetical protein